MAERFNEKANALAQEFWRLQEIVANIKSTDRLAEIERLLEKGIGGKLRDQLEAEAKQLRKEAEDRSGAALRLSDVKKELLELTADLAPNLDLFEDNFFPYDSDHEPIGEQFFAALTDLFFGTPTPSISFKVATISKEGIRVNATAESSPLEILSYIIMILQESAKKRLGVKNTIDNCCALLRQNEYAFIVLKTLLNAGKQLGAKEIKEISHREDKAYTELVRSEVYDKELINGVDFLMSAEWDYSMIKEFDGKYEPTDFGEWVWRICNAELDMDEGSGTGRRSGTSNSALHLQKFLKLLKK
ncbi:MAG: hypothetical protein ACP5E9_04055 [Candidatus Methanospirareceae archaeon]